MKDDSGSHAVFIEQGSLAYDGRTASQITADKVLDVIARLLGRSDNAGTSQF